MQNSDVRGTQNRVVAFCSRSQSTIPIPDSWINVLHSKIGGECGMATWWSDPRSSKVTLLWWLRKVQHQLLGLSAVQKSFSSHAGNRAGLTKGRCAKGGCWHRTSSCLQPHLLIQGWNLVSAGPELIAMERERASDALSQCTQTMAGPLPPHKHCSLCFRQGLAYQECMVQLASRSSNPVFQGSLC